MSSPQSPPERKNLLVPEATRWPLDPDRPMIEMVDVAIGFGENKVLKGLDLAIVPGKTTVVIGRSGSGKSVLLKLMMGLLMPDSGTVRLFGDDVRSLSQVELIRLRKRMSMLFQSYALLDSLTVEDNIGFPLLENTKMPRTEVMQLAHELLEVLGLGHAAHMLPSSLSGGMRKRVSLARALIANPELVLFDEPTTGLDPIMIEKVDEIILMARQQYKITAAIISHDMASTKRLADYVAFLHDGRIIFYGTYDEFMASPLPPLRSFIDGAQTSRLSRASAPTGAAESTDGPADGPRIEAMGGPGDARPAQPTGPAPIVELVGVHKSFGDNYVLRGVDLKIPIGGITVLIGGSGSGKSVIIKHIMGLFKPDRGEIRVFGEDIAQANTEQLTRVRRRIGLLFQHAALLDWMTVHENVAFPLQERSKMSRKEIRDEVQQILERLHITDIMHKLPGEISEGQKKRVGLARAIIVKPEIMIYDEPTTGQDPIRTRGVDDMIQQTQEEFDITSIVISHDMASTFRIGHTIALLNRGQISAVGSPEEVRASTDEYVQHFIYAGDVDGR